MSEMIFTEAELKFMREQGEYFDTHDLSEELENSPEVHFDFSDARSHFYYEIEPELRKLLQAAAHKRGVSAEALLNEWVREKAAESELVSASE